MFVFLWVCVIRPAQSVFFNVLNINPPGEVSRYPTLDSFEFCVTDKHICRYSLNAEPIPIPFPVPFPFCQCVLRKVDQAGSQAA